MELNDLTNLIKSRHSVRKWQSKPVPEDVLLKAIELATYCPNAGNQQNWRFFLITSKKTIEAIADAVQNSANNMAAWPEMIKQGDAAIRMMQRSSFFRTAPAAIAIATSQYKSAVENACDAREKSDPRAAQIKKWRETANSQIQSIGSAGAYLCLILQQMGLATVWMTGPFHAKGEIEKILRVPAGMEVVTFFPIGYPDETPEPKPRKPVKEVTEIIK